MDTDGAAGAKKPSLGSDRDRDAGSQTTLSSDILLKLGREFQELGLSPYESRILLALFQVGSSNTLQLSRLSGVPRTSTYQVLEELAGKNLSQRLPGEGPAVWTSPGRDAVLERLYAAQEERLRDQKARIGRLRAALEESFSESPSQAMPFFQLIPKAAQTKRIFEQLFSEAKIEVLAFSRPPYSWDSGKVNPAVVDAVKRGVKVRAVYQAAQLQDPEADALRAEFAAYVEAGVDARVVDELPIKLVVFDRRVSLVAMEDPLRPEPSYPANLLIEHPGFSGVQADAFEHRWARAWAFDLAAGTLGTSKQVPERG